LAVPDGFISGIQQGGLGEFFLWSFEFLKAGYIRRCLLEPPEQYRQVAIDAIDIIGGDLHPIKIKGFGI
jgi:hypothetical protein